MATFQGSPRGLRCSWRRASLRRCDNTYQTPDPIKNLARAYGISVARKSEQEPYRVFWRLR